MKILINSVFAGGYGFNKGNLPHEMINFFRADDDNFYVYITPYGVMDNTLDLTDLKAILFVRSAGNNLVEVLAKAEFDEQSKFYTKDIQLYGKSNSNSSKIRQMKEDTENQRKQKAQYLEATHNIRYGGKLLSQIHNKNAQDNDIFVSMKVKSICFPKNTFYLTHKKGSETLRPNAYYIGQELDDKSKIANQSMKMYFDEKKQDLGYKQLCELLENDDLWQSSKKTPRFDQNAVTNDRNFFRVTRQQDNEIMFSNMFFYLFSEYPALLREFASEVLGVTLHKNATVEREKERMDLRIIDDDSYIIIENKIKSGINGMISAKTDAETKNGFQTIKGQYISQLSKYYKCAAEKNEKQRTIYGFIFTPNYNPVDKKQYYCGEKYTIVYYSKLYEFFSEYIKDTDNEGAQDWYLRDFVLAMKKHTEETDNEFRDELMQRLAYRIQKTDN